ncbi:MAG: hypothetical protein C4K60_09470 [Ideonella sp. MAG2]|nr:MAG: hypothetical protein C4K60_09470 [Ideonella sp. MAG2]
MADRTVERVGADQGDGDLRQQQLCGLCAASGVRGMNPTRRWTRQTHGFTLVELIVVMVITAIMAASLVVFVRPAVDSYIRVQTREELVQVADNAVTQITSDLRTAIPNSVRSITSQCVELVPSVGGGRFSIDNHLQFSGLQRR